MRLPRVPELSELSDDLRIIRKKEFKRFDFLKIVIIEKFELSESGLSDGTVFSISLPSLNKRHKALHPSIHPRSQ